MKRYRGKAFKTLIALASLVLMTPMAGSAGNLDGRWKYHPAAALRSLNKESQIDRMIEGEKYVYFSVRGNFMSRNSGGHTNTYTTENNLDPIQLFRYDKTQPWQEGSIVAVSDEVEMSGLICDLMNYSPQQGVMAVAYDNRALDFIYDDGTVVATEALKDLSLPARTATPYSITFDRENPLAYVAGSFGYVAIDMRNGEIADYVQTDMPVAWAGRVGDYMVLMAGDIAMPVYSGEWSTPVYSTKTYVYPAGRVPSVLTSPIEGGANLQALMPLSDNSFAALAQGSSETESNLLTFSITPDGVTHETKAEGITYDNGALYTSRHKFRTDGYWQPSKSGYAVHGKEEILMIDASGNVERKSKASLTANEKASKSATWDGSRIWVYTYDTNGVTAADERGFYAYTDNGGSWGGKTAIVVPNAPTSAILNYADWNPKYGMLFRSHGAYFNVQDPDIDRIMAYKDGKWTDLSYSAHNPKYATTPTLSVKEVVSDPLNPDMVWGSSSLAGLVRVDLTNYDNFLEFGNSYRPNYATSYPGYFPIFQYQWNWRSYLNFANVDFDEEGRMWIVRHFYAGYDGDYELESDADVYAKAYTPIYYLTAEEREAIANIGSNQSAIPDFQSRELRVPHTVTHSNPKLMVLKSPQNKNILAVCHGHQTETTMHSFLYDHNGTPENPDDDRHVLIDEIFDEDGIKIRYNWETSIYEDLQTGELWMLTSAGIFIIDPVKMLDGENLCRRLNITSNRSEPEAANQLEFVNARSVADDFLGRKWIATEAGLYCLSADATEILGFYTEKNSRIPSSNVYHVACSPEGSVFVMTDKGVSEFQPEGSLTAVPASASLMIWPSAVAPDFKGYVNITGAEEGAEYIVTDSQGAEKCSLGEASMGALQWDGRDSKGNRLPAGRYNVKRRGHEERNVVILLDE